MTEKRDFFLPDEKQKLIDYLNPNQSNRWDYCFMDYDDTSGVILKKLFTSYDDAYQYCTLNSKYGYVYIDKNVTTANTDHPSNSNIPNWIIVGHPMDEEIQHEAADRGDNQYGNFH